jgi:hypothetical protein
MRAIRFVANQSSGAGAGAGDRRDRGAARPALTLHHQSDITLSGDRVADTTADGRHPDARTA